MNNNTSSLYKQCTICKEEKPATTEFFYRQKSGRYGLRGMCKICKGKKDKKYAEENREDLTVKWRKYNKENRKKINRRNREYYWENVDKIKEQRKKRRKELPKRKQFYDSHKMKLYYQANKDRLKRYANEYRRSERGKEIERKAKQRRKARKNKLLANFTVEQWEECKEFFDNKCCYCGTKTETLHQEHFIPLSKGGEYSKENIVPSCQGCNFRKHTSLFSEWYPTYEHYDKKREEKILKYLGYENEYQQLSIL